MSLAGARLVYRSLNFARSITIARWLGPGEMGVYAVVALALSGLDRISDTGMSQAIIQREGDISSYILPVRTILVLRGLALGLLFYLLAPGVAVFFNSPKSLPIIRVMALFPIIKGLEPLAVTLWQRELRFGRAVLLQTAAAGFSLVIGLLIAHYRPNAWALAWSALSGAIVMTAGAHLLSNRADLGFSLDWRPLKNISGFAFWIFVTGIVSYLFIKGGDWMIGSLLDVRALALYQMAYLICISATAEIGQVVSQLSFPMFSRLQNDPPRLETAFRNSFGLISLVTIGMAGLVCACAPDGFRFVLGKKWLPALPLVPWLTVWGVCSMFAGCISGLFQALGKPKLWTKTIFYMVGLLALGVYPLTRWFGGLGVAILMAGIGVIMQVVRYKMISQLLHIPWLKVFGHIAVPALACLAAAVITSRLRKAVTLSGPLSGLLFSAGCVLVVYALLLALGRRWMEPSPLEMVKRIRSLLSGAKNTREPMDP